MEPLGKEQAEAGYDMHGGSGNGSAGFVAGRSTGGVLGSVVGGTRYQAVVADGGDNGGGGGYDEVGGNRLQRAVVCVRNFAVSVQEYSPYILSASLTALHVLHMMSTWEAQKYDQHHPCFRQTDLRPRPRAAQNFDPKNSSSTSTVLPVCHVHMIRAIV